MSHERARAGVLFALTAFGVWGLAPLYFKLIQHIDHLEIVAHRIVWTASALLAILLTASRASPIESWALTRRTFGLLCLSAAFIGVNWITFTWAVTNDRVLDASLGYFINPLVNVMLGVVFLRERLRRAQQAAVLLAAAGVSAQIVNHGGLPWVALILPLAFGMYGLVRKQLSVNSVYGLFIETLILFPLAGAYLGYLGLTQQGAFGSHDFRMSVLLILGAPVTIVPLTCFVAGAKRINLSTIGFIQYLAPSITFLLAVFAFREPFGIVQKVTFGCIWISLIVFSVDGFRSTRRELHHEQDSERIPK